MEFLKCRERGRWKGPEKLEIRTRHSTTITNLADFNSQISRWNFFSSPEPPFFWSASRIAASFGSDLLCKHKRMGLEQITFVRLDFEKKQGDRKSVNRRLPMLKPARWIRWRRYSCCWPKGVQPQGTKMAALKATDVNAVSFPESSFPLTSGRKTIDYGRNHFEIA